MSSMIFPSLYVSLDGTKVTMIDLIIYGFAFGLGICSLVLNCVVLDTFRKSSRLHDMMGYFITNMAVADTLISIFVIYNNLYNLVVFQHATECLFRFGMLNALNITSVLTLAALTLDRYLKIVHPYLHEKHVSSLGEKIALAIIWAVSLLVGLLPLMGWSNITHGEFTCSYFGAFTKGYMILIVTMFFIPFVLMIILYTHLIHISMKHARMIASQNTGGSHPNRATWKSTKTVCLIIGAYFLCWGPLGFYIIVVISDSRIMEGVNEGQVLAYLAPIAFSNSIINPMIYAFKINEVRDKFKAFCCCLCRKHRTSSSDTTSVLAMSQTSSRSPRHQTNHNNNNSLPMTRKQGNKNNSLPMQRKQEHVMTKTISCFTVATNV
ncbi:G-protein coupled receptor 12 [Lingula anatina]|uniref:G-protein coupled receptor 12 n=1 Tax=Lingula anatina TaxID=7574 RepID=A0A1S3HDD0_LINAN|nr:G-protein coupled receptor 12 [Lingula anatina]XP_013384043.1 G-protein coupled receptor 12 [Lingula anatina]|eukprot:XP_013384042.1 G-protein coupled receptor 12 [Lingula anatina]